MSTQSAPAEESHSHPKTHADHIEPHPDCMECQEALSAVPEPPYEIPVPSLEQVTGRDSSAAPPVEEAAAKIDFASKLRAVQVEQQQIVRLPDGSARVNIVIDSEMMPVLESWAEGAGESFEEYLPKMIGMGLQAIVNGGSVAG